MRSLRRALSEEAQQAHSTAVCQQLMNHPQWTTWQHIAFYEAHDGEIDLSLCIEKAWQAQKTVYLPQLYDHQLQFGQITRKTQLTANRYGILEPQHTTFCAAETLDCILVPLVAFDRTGARLGMGMGYYDRALANLNTQNTPALIGIAHACQEVGLLVRKPWDIPLPCFITEEGIITP